MARTAYRGFWRIGVSDRRKRSAPSSCPPGCRRAQSFCSNGPKGIVRHAMDGSPQSRQSPPPTEPESAALHALIEKFKAEALADAERIAVLRAQVESTATDVPALLFAHHQLCRRRFGPPDPCIQPPADMPAHLLDAFTMGGISSVEYAYSDNTYPANWPLVYTDNEIDQYLARIARRQWFIYGMVDVWLWEAIA